MVTLTINYLTSFGDTTTYTTDPMPVNAAMDRVMRFVQAGVDVINHYDSGCMEVLLLHRVTGMVIAPVAG